MPTSRCRRATAHAAVTKPSTHHAGNQRANDQHHRRSVIDGEWYYPLSFLSLKRGRHDASRLRGLVAWSPQAFRPMPRYVILRHENRNPAEPSVHWDLMLEAGTSLRTWALAALPVAGESIAAEQLPDHRLHYLDYEGPISGNRGKRSHAGTRGTFEIVSESPRRTGHRTGRQATVRGSDAFYRGRRWAVGIHVSTRRDPINSPNDRPNGRASAGRARRRNGG